MGPPHLLGAQEPDGAPARPVVLHPLLGHFPAGLAGCSLSRGWSLVLGSGVDEAGVLTVQMAPSLQGALCFHAASHALLAAAPCGGGRCCPIFEMRK